MSRRRAVQVFGVLLALLLLALGLWVLFFRASEHGSRPSAASTTPTDSAPEVGPGVEAESDAPPGAPDQRERTRVRPADTQSAGDLPRLEVLVTDNGAPVAGARVLVMPELAIRTRKGGDLQKPAAWLAEGRTGADGTATLPFVWYWAIRVVAVSGTRAGVSGRVQPAKTGTSKTETRLAEGVRARGVVVAATDRPVSGAEVSISHVGPWVGMGNRYGNGFTAITDEQGRFDLGTLPIPTGQDGFVMRVRGDGFADLDGELTVGDLRKDPVIIRVSGLVSVRGVVRRRDGGPAVSARVRLLGRETHTDDGGAFAFDNVQAVGGTLHILGRFARASHTTVGPFTEKDNDLGELWLDVSGVIAGTLRHENGDPAPGVRVGAGLNAGDWRWTKTDVLGRFEIFDVAAGEHRIDVKAPARTICVREDATLTATPGDPALELILYAIKRPSGVSVRIVLDPPQREDVAVTFRFGPVRSISMAGFVHMMTAVKEYHFGADGAGEYTVSAHAKGWTGATETVDVPAEGFVDVDLVLTPED